MQAFGKQLATDIAAVVTYLQRLGNKAPNLVQRRSLAVQVTVNKSCLGAARMSAVADTHAHHDDHGHHPAGIMRWITTTNTRTSARCTCGSASRCSWSAG
jgi:hypothetical protein